MLYNLVEQVEDVAGRCFPILAHPVVFSRPVYHGEIELFFCRVQIAHEVEHHFVHLFGTAVRFIHFVDDHDGLQAYFECFLQHKTRLGHRAFECVY